MIVSLVLMLLGKEFLKALVLPIGYLVFMLSFALDPFDLIKLSTRARARSIRVIGA